MVGVHLVEYYSDPLTKHDVALFKHSIGDADGQQTWEALNLLVSLRQWKHHWQQVRVKLHVKADNIHSLRLVSTLKATGRNARILGRELALDLGDGAFSPDWTIHVPGVAHDVADALSRKTQPGKAYTLPPVLEGAKEVSPAQRRLA